MHRRERSRGRGKRRTRSRGWLAGEIPHAEVSNGELLYHEVHEGKPCVVHCVNTSLQGPFFSVFDLAALAADLDQWERLVILEGSYSLGAANAAGGDFLTKGSHNISLGVISPSKHSVKYRDY